MNSKKILELETKIKQLEALILKYKKREQEQKGIQRTLEQSEDRYLAVFQNTGTATFVMAPDKTISIVNSGFEQ